jgi:hypothetical protein
MARITKDNTKEINTLTTNVAVILNDVGYIKQEVNDIKTTIEKNEGTYTSRLECGLVNREQDRRIDKIEKLVFGAVGLALITLGKAILDLVIVAKAASP